MELKKRGKKNLTPKELIRVSSYSEHINEYYTSLQEFGSDWARAYGFYTEVASFKVYAAMGGIVGLDFERAESWLKAQFHLEGFILADIMRRIKIIDHVLTDQYNSYLESKNRQGQVSASSSRGALRGRV